MLKSIGIGTTFPLHLLPWVIKMQLRISKLQVVLKTTATVKTYSLCGARVGVVDHSPCLESSWAPLPLAFYILGGVNTCWGRDTYPWP